VATSAKKTTLSKHSAAGQAAGYLYEPERALYWLARSPGGSTVAVEAEDDVAVHLANGGSVLEQDKHSIDPNRIPFGDTSKDLWNTLAIWLGAIKAKDVAPALTEFYLTTNKVLPDCIVRRLRAGVDSIPKCIQDLRGIGKAPPAGLRDLVTSVLKFTDAELKLLLSRVRICDGTDSSSGLALRAEVAALLHLPPSLPWDHLLDGLSGWINNLILKQWREGRPAFIRRDDFDVQYQTLLSKFRERAVRADPEHLVEVQPSEVKKLLAAEFVEQLRAVSLVDENEEVIEAINDYLRCGRERLRLSDEGDLSKDDIIAFDNALERKWKQICRIRVGRPGSAQPSPDLADLGYQVLMDALSHREPLGGVEQEQYMTSGAFHWLADVHRVWWHPKYRSMKSA